MNNPTSSSNDTISDTLPPTTLEALPEPLRQAAARAGWTALMPVQAQAIPYLLAGRDMLIQAQTGSGKTGAFLLPMLVRLDPAQNYCQALVLVPTRELAHQVSQTAEILCQDSGLRTAAVYGGVGYGPQNEALRKGAQIVVGTPGRVLDHLLKRTLSLDNLSMLVFDEADRMLSMGFYPDMKQLQRYLPGHDLHTCMFSATFPAYVIRTAHEFIADPAFLSLSQEHVHVPTTEHVIYPAPDVGRERSLIRILEIENPTSAIIFCNTKAHVQFLTIVLQRFGYDADGLSADLDQPARERVLARIRQGALRLLVATDVAARGLDIPDLSHVIQYEAPEDPESYIHRTGRTGRAGASGVAITLANRSERMALQRIASRYDIDMHERPLPTDDDVAAVVAERLTALLEARLRDRDRLHNERSRRFLPLARSLAGNEDELSIIAMLLDDYYQQVLHAPLVQPAEPARGVGQRSLDAKKRRRRRPPRRR